MLRELTKHDWHVILDLPPERVPAVLIVRGTRNFRARYRAMRPAFDRVLDVGTPNGVLEDVLVGEVRGWPVGFACVYGAAMASEVVHLFGVLGTRAVVQIGNCGALADDFAAGDLFVAERAFCGEGAAQYYKPDGRWAEASTTLLRSATLATLGPGAYRQGAIYTTGALFAEGMADVERWHADGFAAVDMETATTYAVAEHFGMERLAILYGFDNPRQREHLLLSDQQKDAQRAEADRTVRYLALDLAVEVCARMTARQAAPPDTPIRDARVEDAEALLALWRQAQATPSPTDTLAEVRRAIAEGPATVLVAERQGELVGSAIGGFDGWRGNVYRLAVHPGHRRQGLARALVAELERRLVEQGARRITALVEKDHPEALTFWQAVGYRTDQRLARLVRDLEPT